MLHWRIESHVPDCAIKLLSDAVGLVTRVAGIHKQCLWEAAAVRQEVGWGRVDQVHVGGRTLSCDWRVGDEVSRRGHRILPVLLPGGCGFPGCRSPYLSHQRLILFLSSRL